MRWKAWIFPLGVTAVLSWVAVRQVDLPRLWELLSGARLRWAAVMAALIPLQMALRSKRWAILLNGSRPDTRELFKINFIGAAIDNVLFMRLGELARAMLASRRLSIPLARTVSTIAVERILDLASLLAVFSLAAATSREVVPGPARQAAFLILVAALAAIAALLAAGGPLAPGGFIERALRTRPRIHKLTLELSAGASGLRSASSAAPVVLLSLAFWAVDTLFYWAAAHCLELTPALTYGRSMLVVTWAAAGSALPSVPGAFGSFEAAVKFILEATGVESTQALGYAVLSHMVAYVVLTSLGLIFLYREGITLASLRGELSRRRDEEANPAAP